MTLVRARTTAPHPTPSTGDDRHMPQLDGLRCFAVLLVLWQHTAGTGLDIIGIMGVGAYGVWLFFVLSGFLITGILLRARDAADYQFAPTLRTFYTRRVLRIFPLYYLVVLLCAWFGVGHSFRADLPWHLAYMTNWRLALTDRWMDAANPLWSLSIEEQFYLVWPALVLLTPAKYTRAMLCTIAGIGVMSRILLVIALPHRGAWAVLAPTTSNLDPLALGGLVAWGRMYAPEETPDRVWRAVRYGLPLLVLALVLSHTARLKHSAGFTVLETVVAECIAVWLVYWAATGWPPGSAGARILGGRVVRYVGTISYGIYLMHEPLHWMLMRAGVLGPLGHPDPAHGGALGEFVILTVCSIGLAAFSWRFYEHPINRLKRFFPYKGGDTARHMLATPVLAPE